MNTVVLSGRLASEPELRTSDAGANVVNFRIAVDREYVKGQEKKADFFSIVAFRNTALFVEKYFKKGSPIALTGKLRTRSYDDKNGVTRNVTEIYADSVEFNGSREKEATGTAPQASPQSAAPSASAKTTTPETPNFGYSDDEDLPF